MSSKSKSKQRQTTKEYRKNYGRIFRKLKRTAKKSPYGCKCQTLQERVLGDGCDICNPELAEELKEE